MSRKVAIEASESTSGTLLERVQRHEPEAWRRFATLYGPIIFRWSRKSGLQPQDASEVSQEVFLSVVQNISRFQRRSASDSLRGWLWAVTRNKVRDHFRQRQGEPTAAGGTSADEQLQQIPNLPETNDESPKTLAVELSHRALTLIQNEFEPTTWQTFWSISVEGRSTADTALDLGISLAAAYKAKSRVLLRLRRELEGLLE
jgi:RNA polymerase sigma-70 factor, ECF subfamily